MRRAIPKGTKSHPLGRPLEVPLEPLNDEDYRRARQEAGLIACEQLLKRLREHHPERDHNERH